MSDSTAIERRSDYGDKLAEVMGGGDVMAMVAQVEANVRAITDIARKRGFITQFRQEDKKTGEVKTTEFYGLSAWQILGLVYGVTPVVEWVKPVDGGYHARAIAQTRDGTRVGGAEAFCHRKEPGKGFKSEHDIAAVAQGRAERNALRAALGAILVLAGYDVPDPDAPATAPQIGMLHQLERELGWTHDQGHVEAGDVDSFKDLSREQAAEVIDRWTATRDANPRQGQGRQTTSPDTANPAEDVAPGEEATVYGEGAAPPPPEVIVEDDGTLATPVQWERANASGVKSAAILRVVRKGHPEVRSASEITRVQFTEAFEELLSP